jgi:hypothetical protein
VVARRPGRADGAVGPARFVPARRDPLAVPVRGGLAAVVARRPERADGAVGPARLRAAGRDELAVPELELVAAAELARGPVRAHGPVRVASAAASEAQVVPGRVAALVARGAR